MADEAPQTEAPEVAKSSFFDPADVRAAAQTAATAWLNGLRNTAVSRNTGAWNAVQASLPALVDAIVEEITK